MNHSKKIKSTIFLTIVNNIEICCRFHFSFSLTQLVTVLVILGLLIASTVTQTCAYHFGIGFWSFPFLLISPLSIWLVIWRRSSISCLIAILIHFCSTLFATAIIIISFLVLYQAKKISELL
ncbi:unnamed protein product [Rotaria sp. Silwood1]|nr:unnamed protein product [Rotaria sp. Silwood1]